MTRSLCGMVSAIIPGNGGGSRITFVAFGMFDCEKDEGVMSGSVMKTGSSGVGTCALAFKLRASQDQVLRRGV